MGGGLPNCQRFYRSENVKISRTLDIHICVCNPENIVRSCSKYVKGRGLKISLNPVNVVCEERCTHMHRWRYAFIYCYLSSRIICSSTICKICATASMFYMCKSCLSRRGLTRSYRHVIWFDPNFRGNILYRKIWIVSNHMRW